MTLDHETATGPKIWRINIDLQGRDRSSGHGDSCGLDEMLICSACGLPGDLYMWIPTALSRLYDSNGMKNYRLREVPQQLTEELKPTQIHKCEELQSMETHL
jgi:hypothetical protein